MFALHTTDCYLVRSIFAKNFRYLGRFKNLYTLNDQNFMMFKNNGTPTAPKNKLHFLSPLLLVSAITNHHVSTIVTIIHTLSTNHPNSIQFLMLFHLKFICIYFFFWSFPTVFTPGKMIDSFYIKILQI